jgi:hypothetical protein
LPNPAEPRPAEPNLAEPTPAEPRLAEIEYWLAYAQQDFSGIGSPVFSGLAKF